MANAAENDDAERRIVLGLLESVERDGGTSQRRLAAELGIALGLVNAYLKRCIKKGLVKVAHAPARRYAYYLTPQGFSEKSRLTVEYLSYSFSFFRAARADCSAALSEARSRGFTRIALAGISDLAEISTICAAESGVTIVGVVDSAANPGVNSPRFIGLPVFSAYSELGNSCDAVLLTDLRDPLGTLAEARGYFGAERVLMPELLTGRLRKTKGRAA